MQCVCGRTRPPMAYAWQLHRIGVLDKVPETQIKDGKEICRALVHCHPLRTTRPVPVKFIQTP